MAPKAVLFDVDGTLVDSNELHVQAWREAFHRHGKELSREEIHAHMGKGGDQLLQALLSEDERRKFGKDVDRLHLETFMREHQPRERPLPCVRELLQRLKADGVRIALASSAKEKELAGHLRVLGVDDLVDATTTADDADCSKPCPDIFEAALKRLGNISPQETVVIGDSPYDAQAARNAGIRMVGVLTGGFSEKRLRDHGAAAVYRDLCDLLEHYGDAIVVRP